jgi:hypothetical protein
MGGSSFGLSALTGFIAKGLNLSGKKHQYLMAMVQSFAGAPQSEEDKTRAHELKLREIDGKEKRQRLMYEDVDKARGERGEYRSFTRRVLAFTVPFVFFMIAVMAVMSVIKNVPAVSIPVTNQHEILWGIVSWTSQGVQELKGFVILPWVKQWAFMIGGFYFGISATK